MGDPIEVGALRTRKKITHSSLGDRSNSASVAMMSMNTYRASFPLEGIITDPANPRAAQLKLANVNPETVTSWCKQEEESESDWSDRLSAHIETLEPLVKEEWGYLYELASSILSLGLCQPIVLNSKTTQIVAGERRYWASRLAGKSDAPVILRDVSASDTAGLRFAENFMRRDLPLGAEIDSIRAVVDGLLMEGKTKPFNLTDNLPTAKELSLLTGIKPTNAYYYLKFLEIAEDHSVMVRANRGEFPKIYKAYQALKSYELSKQETPVATIDAVAGEEQSSTATPKPTGSDQVTPEAAESSSTKTTPSVAPVKKESAAPKKHKPRIALPPLNSLKQLARLIDLLRIPKDFNQILKPSQLYHLDTPEGLKEANKDLKAIFELLDK